VLERCAADPGLERPKAETKGGAMAFPLGVYPIEAIEPRAGYSVRFEQADGDNESGEWEEWPDRYVFEVVCPATRLRPLWRTLASLLPARVYPILDVMGHDAYREVDPYIAYELVGVDHVLDAVQRYGPFLFEDGMVGFGAMCDDPFFYIFFDEHKIITIRCLPEDKERVEQALSAFDLEPVAEPVGVDAVAHEHRSILLTPDDQPDLLTPEEIVEHLRDEWALTLNIDTETNVDDDGRDLGTTAWRCLVRVRTDREEDDLTGEDGADEDAADALSDDPITAWRPLQRLRPSPEPEYRYAEVLLQASSLREAEELAYDAAADLQAREPAPPAKTAPKPEGAGDEASKPPEGEPEEPPEDPDEFARFPDAFVVSSDRVTPEAFGTMLEAAGQRGAKRVRQGVARVHAARWLH